MKKLILSVALVALTGVATMAQTAKDVRDEARQVRITEVVEAMKSALATQNFMFIPSQLQLAYQGPINLGNLTFAPYLEAWGKSLAVNLPYSLQNMAPNSKIFDLYMPNVPYTYSVKQGNGYTYYVTIGLRNVANQNAGFMPIQTQSMNMTIHMTINIINGYTTMTIVPEFAAPVTYFGTTSSTN